MDFSTRLRTEREKKNLTQVDLAEKLKISKQTVWKYEKGDAIPSVPTLLEIADILDCSMDYLFGRTDNRGISIVEYEQDGKKIKVGVPTEQKNELDLIKAQTEEILKRISNLEK